MPLSFKERQGAFVRLSAHPTDHEARSAGPGGLFKFTGKRLQHQAPRADKGHTKEPHAFTSCVPFLPIARDFRTQQLCSAGVRTHGTHHCRACCVRGAGGPPRKAGAACRRGPPRLRARRKDPAPSATQRPKKKKKSARESRGFPPAHGVKILSIIIELNKFRAGPSGFLPTECYRRLFGEHQKTKTLRRRTCTSFSAIARHRGASTFLLSTWAAQRRRGGERHAFEEVAAKPSSNAREGRRPS